MSETASRTSSRRGPPRETSPATPVSHHPLDPSTEAWFADLVRGVELVGDANLRRPRATFFENAAHPHHYTPEERRRMDRYEGIDYAEPQTLLHRRVSLQRWRQWADARSDGDEEKSFSQLPGDDRDGWLRVGVFCAIGVCVGVWAVLLFQSLDYLFESKMAAVQSAIRGPEKVPPPLSAAGVLKGYVLYVGWGFFAAVLSSLCCLVMPSAAGSGIPDVMAYLNGVMFPRIFNIRNLVVKTLSCMLAVSAGLPVGTEGPMIHIGSLIGAGLPTGRSRSLHCSATSVFARFRNPRDQRDFISAGAACGLTSAFSSPLGGMLFVYEEIATHFPQQLAWMVLLACLCCMTVIQVANTLFSGWHWLPVETGKEAASVGTIRDAAISMFYVGLVPESFVPMNMFTFVPTVVTAVVAGLLSVGYTVLSIRCTRWRVRRLFPVALYRVLEPCVLAVAYSTLCFVLPLLTPCEAIPNRLIEEKETLHVEFFSAFCAKPASEFHPLATLTMSSPYNGLRLLFTRRTSGLFPAWALLIHLLLYMAGSLYASGMFISCGTVIPSLLIGAVTGRAVGVLGFAAAPSWADEGVLALIGAASYFAGISRLTFALVVIMMEITSDLTHNTALMLGALLAKTIADACCHSFYHATLEVKAVPFLEAQSDMHLLDTHTVQHFMSSPVVTVETVDTLLHVVEVLLTTEHNAFPVVHGGPDRAEGAYAGMITRKELELLLWVVYLRWSSGRPTALEDEEDGEGNEIHADHTPPNDAAAAMADDGHSDAGWNCVHDVSLKELHRVREYIFWNRLPSRPPMRHLPLDRMTRLVDLRLYVDGSAPVVHDVVCVSRAYYQFRHLALRHLPVLDRHQRVVGMLTRTNFVGDRLMERLEGGASGDHG